MNQDVVRVGSIAGIAASIPYLLGFQPAESLVIIGLETSRLVFTMRIDLQAPDLDALVVTEVVSRMADYDEVICAILNSERSLTDSPKHLRLIILAKNG